MRALVLDGGGMRGAFTAGLLEGFSKNGIGYKFFDCYVGSSAGACCIAYFLADQVEQGLRIWLEHLPNGFMRWRGVKPHNDLAYLEKVFREIEPLSVTALHSRKEMAFAVVSNPKSLKDEYINLNRAPDPVSVLLAGVAMPFFSGPFMLNGSEYYDGGLTSAIPIRQAEREGANEIWVVATTPNGFRRTALFWKIASWLATRNPEVRKLLANRPFLENRVLEEVERRTDIVLIRPERDLPARWRTSNRGAIRAAVKIGREAATRVLHRKNMV